MNGNWTGRFVGGIATPTAELGDNPSGPGERFLAVRIALERGFAIEAIVDRIEDFDLVRGEDGTRIKFFAAISSSLAKVGVS